MIQQLIMTFLATFSFCVLFNVPRSELSLAGLVGVCSWFVYLTSTAHGSSAVLATFFATMVVTIVSRILAGVRKMPLTVFLIAGIIPLVPGAGIYNTMYLTITGDMFGSLRKGIETFSLAGVIAIGIMVVLTVPLSWFQFTWLSTFTRRIFRRK